jgi:hypothetical protein
MKVIKTPSQLSSASTIALDDGSVVYGITLIHMTWLSLDIE